MKVSLTRVTRRLRYWVFICVGVLLLAMGVIAGDGLHERLDHADIAIVLGNTVNSNGQPSARLTARLDKVVALYWQGWFTQILVSGGLGQEGFDEAVVMKRYLVARGLPAEIIFVDSAGNTTRDTARNAAALMRKKGWHRALVISQFFHLPRCRLALQQEGILNVFSAHANYFELRDVYSTFREVIAYGDYLWSDVTGLNDSDRDL